MKGDKILYKHKAVMLIDDNTIDNFVNGKTIKSSLFANAVYTHTSVSSGLEFLKNMEIIKDSLPEIIPEIIFLDINLPMLDGFQFLDEFEKFSFELKSKIKIIILTSSLNPNDLAKSKAYKSVIDYHYKPLLAKDLNTLPVIEFVNHNV